MHDCVDYARRAIGWLALIGVALLALGTATAASADLAGDIQAIRDRARGLTSDRDVSDLFWQAAQRGLPGELDPALQKAQHDFLWDAASAHYRVASQGPEPEEKYARRSLEAWKSYVDWFGELRSRGRVDPAVNKVNTAAEYQFMSRRFVARATGESFAAHFDEFQSGTDPTFWNLKVVRGLISAVATCEAWDYPASTPAPGVRCSETCVSAAEDLRDRINTWLAKAQLQQDREAGVRDLNALSRRIHACTR